MSLLNLSHVTCPVSISLYYQSYDESSCKPVLLGLRGKSNKQSSALQIQTQPVSQKHDLDSCHSVPPVEESYLSVAAIRHFPLVRQHNLKIFPFFCQAANDLT